MAFIPIPNCSGFATVTLTSVEPLTPPDTAQKGAAEKLSVSLRSLSGNKVAVKVAGKGVKQPVGKVTVRFGKVAKTYQLKAKANGRLTVKIPAKAIKASKTGAVKITAAFHGTSLADKVSATPITAKPKPKR